MRDSLYRSAELAAEELLRDWSGTPPVDLQGLALAMGVAQIVTRPISSDGRLEVHSDRKVIVVDAGAGDTRRRFTIAHELGHVWLGARGSRALSLDPARQERFCNAFAAALLLPSQWIVHKAGEHEPGLEALRAISGEASVSMASCLIRLHRFPDWRKTLMQWRWDEGDWRLWSIAGTSLRHRSQIDSVEKTRRTISLIRRVGGGVHRCPLWLGIGSQERQVEAELMVDRGCALALVSWQEAVDPEEPWQLRPS
ncbi:MAG TPA: ImmA/IrrE family metallo-endopeptidase [Solirubrobacterales bacterium]|nr:ImmA/IrrE family metallo-endopeptidase [Solirubrobacterales bacterium]